MAYNVGNYQMMEQIVIEKKICNKILLDNGKLHVYIKKWSSFTYCGTPKHGVNTFIVTQKYNTPHL